MCDAGGSSGSPPLFFFWRETQTPKSKKREEKGTNGGLTTSPFPSCPNFIAPSPPPLIEQSPSLCDLIANYGDVTVWSTSCCMRWRRHIGNSVTLPAILFWKNASGPQLPPFFIATGRWSYCRPARRHGKPLSPPATIAATETIKDLYHMPLPTDLLPGRRGRCWRQQQFDHVIHLNAIDFSCRGGRRQSYAAAATMTTLLTTAVLIKNLLCTKWPRSVRQTYFLATHFFGILIVYGRVARVGT
jgi:hypothetical protein